MAFIHEEINQEIKKWAKDRQADIKQEINTQGIKHRKNSSSPGPSKDTIKARFRTDPQTGIINRIGFIMPRHMVYVHKGVGKETPIEKAGQTNRKAKPWFNPVISRKIDELADIVAVKLGASIINNVYIKGEQKR